MKKIIEGTAIPIEIKQPVFHRFLLKVIFFNAFSSCLYKSSDI